MSSCPFSVPLVYTLPTTQLRHIIRNSLFCLRSFAPFPIPSAYSISTMQVLTTLESLFGWVYFVAWSATFWPQVLLINRRRTTAGLSTDFVTINIIGFISYAIFTFSSYTLPAVAASYVASTGYPPQVELADVLFAAHGAIMCAVLVLQVLILPPRIPPSPLVAVVGAASMALVAVGLATSLVGNLDWYFFLRCAGMLKVMCSVVKHFPQVFLNQHRNSTVGWSYTMVLLDVVGGSFSVAQQIVRSVSMGSLAPFTSNMAKTMLAAESLAFDFFFIAQHAIFYPDRTDIDLVRPKESGLADVESSALLERSTTSETQP